MIKVKLRAYFLTGLLIVIPLVVSTWLLVFFIQISTDYIFRIVGFFYPIAGARMVILVRILSLVIAFWAVAFIGMFARNVFGKRVLGFMDLLLVRIPLFNRIYMATKQISQAFIGEEKTIFKRVVLVQFPRKGVYAIGFVTSEARGEPQKKTATRVINVFVPTTPNPTSGTLIMVPEDEIIRLDMSVEDGMKLVISGGAVVPYFAPGSKNGAGEQTTGD